MKTDGARALLALLRKAPGPLSGADLARRFGISRAAVHKRIEKLRAVGHRVTGTPRMGYRLRAGADGFDAVPLHGFAGPLLHRPVVPSTQDEVKNRAARGAPEGLIVVADRQRAGRGRRGRVWSSPAGGLWYSILLRPAAAPAHAPSLALVAALDWADTLRARGVPAGVKWPNDVWADGKKIGGVLTEMALEPDRVQWMVLGIGVNVNNRAPVIPGVGTGAVRDWAGPTPRGELLSEWLARFARSYVRHARGGFAPFQRAYNTRSVLNGCWVTGVGPDGPVRGRALGVDPAGRLRLSAGGRTIAVVGGDVVLLRPAR
ncbi:MAG: biotin--[acetyl-CoA-carboxylase] ligase [Elusimicrobia bacterium]|nr:biotin--[acetyl-CoA-carboxylase] ligase [Elusimicrobiota bacterium]MBP8004040.1 biotin--[acetyl-CoA-carboxylase] ligase [Elusimicrobiota bacterium]